MKLKTIQTNLETAKASEIPAILDKKAETVGANGTADYVFRAIDNIESSKERISNAIKELQSLKKDLDSQEDIIKESAAKWLQDNGIDKLNGDIISSISAYYKKESIEVVVMDEEAVINAGYFKMVIDKTALKEALLNDMAVEGAKLEVTYSQPSLRVNKRRNKQDENHA